MEASSEETSRNLAGEPRFCGSGQGMITSVYGRATLEYRHVYPYLGNWPISEESTIDVLAADAIHQIH